MNWRAWFALRGPRYAFQRVAILLGRYGLTPGRAMARAEETVAALARAGCSLTYPAPGRVVEHHPAFFRRLQSAGAEISVHSYDHVDLATYPPPQAVAQLMRAATAFQRHGIEVHGFRCPYLRCSEDLLAALPVGPFEYSSNEAIWWDVAAAAAPAPGQPAASTSIWDVLREFYRPSAAQDTLCLPRMRESAVGLGVVEIPVCVPDDLQLHDGLHMNAAGIAAAWQEMLCRTHQRGELFDLIFHPELADLCRAPLLATVAAARQLQPAVWIAPLRDVSGWWREKAGFGVTVVALDGQQVGSAKGRLRVTFSCSERATILVRGLDVGDAARPWDGTYEELKAREIDIPAGHRPFVGLPAGAPSRIVTRLRELGYLVDTGPTAVHCGVYLDAVALAGLLQGHAGWLDEVRLVEAIESAGGPLIRYGCWPGGAKSGLCISGDLDALTLFDYAARLVVR